MSHLLLTGRTGEATVTQAAEVSENWRICFISTGLTADIILIIVVKLRCWFE